VRQAQDRLGRTPKHRVREVRSPLSPPSIFDSAESLQNKALPGPPALDGVARRNTAVRQRDGLTLPPLKRRRESESLENDKPLPLAAADTIVRP
jgi:hypothetical protein